jgi:hypothetical protein
MRMREGYDIDLLGIDSCRTQVRDGSADIGADLWTKARLTKSAVHTAAGVKKH